MDKKGFYAIVCHCNISCIYYWNGERFTDELAMLSSIDWRKMRKNEKVRYKSPTLWNLCESNIDTPMVYIGE